MLTFFVKQINILLKGGKVLEMDKMKIDSFKINVDEHDKKFIFEKINNVMDSGTDWTDGTYVKQFEESFCQFLSCRYGVGVNSGGAALQIVLMAMGYDSQECLAYLPTLTAPPTVISCLHAGMKVIFIDSNKTDMGMDIHDLEEKINLYKNRYNGVIIPVHIGGLISQDIDKIVQIGHKNGIPIIEDCAHAHGATFNGIPAGLRGYAGIFSFFLTKVLMSGEGGIIVTNNTDVRNKCMMIRNYGKENGVYVHKGFNWRLSEFNAITALWQTLNANKIIRSRRNIAAFYDFILGSHQHARILDTSNNSKSAFYKYIVFLPEEIDTDTVSNTLKEKYFINLSGCVYKRPCHKEPVFLHYANSILNYGEAFPVSEYIAKTHICLPIYPGLNQKEADYVASSLCSVLEDYGK